MRHSRSFALAIAMLACVSTSCASGTRERAIHTPIPSASPSLGPYIGWKVYRSRWEGATFRYPPDWIAAKESIQTGAGNAPGDQVRLTSPDGFMVTWLAPLAGIGGACDASRSPHIFIDRILTMPVDGSRHPLYVILASIEHHKTLAVVDVTSFAGKPPKTGDTGACLFYPIFQSKTHTDLSIVQFITGSGVQLGNGVESHDGSERLTDDQYLETRNVKTTLMIFRSIHY